MCPSWIRCTVFLKLNLHFCIKKTIAQTWNRSSYILKHSIRWTRNHCIGIKPNTNPIWITNVCQHCVDQLQSWGEALPVYSKGNATYISRKLWNQTGSMPSLRVSTTLVEVITQEVSWTRMNWSLHSIDVTWISWSMGHSWNSHLFVLLSSMIDDAAFKPPSVTWHNTHIEHSVLAVCPYITHHSFALLHLLQYFHTKDHLDAWLPKELWRIYRNVKYKLQLPKMRFDVGIQCRNFQKYMSPKE